MLKSFRIYNHLNFVLYSCIYYNLHQYRKQRTIPAKLLHLSGDDDVYKPNSVYLFQDKTTIYLGCILLHTSSGSSFAYAQDTALHSGKNFAVSPHLAMDSSLFASLAFAWWALPTTLLQSCDWECSDFPLVSNKFNTSSYPT